MKNVIKESVMTNQPRNKRNVPLSGADFYPTPTWATRALLDNETFEGNIWEPACGNGAMGEVIKERYQNVETSDIHNHGYKDFHKHDFLTGHYYADNIITNPPYNLAEEFVHAGLKQCNNKLALLMRLAFLECQRRCEEIYSIYPPSRVYIFSERLTFYPAGQEFDENGNPKTGGQTSYIWMVWEKPLTGKTELKWIKPGARK